MGRLKYGVNLLTYDSSGFDTFDAEVADGIFRRLKGFGYDGVELTGIPERMDELKPQKELLASYELEPVLITGAWGVFGSIVNTYPNKDPTSSDAARRADAVEYIARCAEMASDLGAPYVLVALGSLDRPMDTSEKGIAKARKNLVEVLKKASRLTKRSGIKLLLEPQCRFEGYYGVNTTTSQVLGLLEEVHADNISPMIDTFHANIEETSIPRAIERAGRRLAHVHLADSNRLGPGFGNIDFKSVARSLQELDYDGYLSLECVPAGPDPDGMCEQSLTYLRSLQALSAAQAELR